MWMPMLISYTIVALIDLRIWYKDKDKRKLYIYLALMAISCMIGTANAGFTTVPSPARPIKQIVFYILGK